MATATGSFVWLPETLPEELAGEDGVLQIPPGVHTLAGFRRWLLSDEFPEKLKAHFIQGNIYLDMSQEAIQTHVLVKKAVYQTLPNLIDDADLGEFYTDGILLTNKRARIANKPDGLAVLWETIESERVRFLARQGVELEIQGTPDWIMEIVSKSSVTKDKKQLRKAYHKAGIPEYWLIDARGEEILFHILHWRSSGYTAAPGQGWLAAFPGLRSRLPDGAAAKPPRGLALPVACETVKVNLERALASMLYGVRPESRERDYPRPHEQPSPPLVGRWGVLGYYIPDGLMHPDDVKRYLEGPLQGECFFCCVREETPFAVVRNNAGREFRVAPARFIWITTPRFQMGDAVATKVGTQRVGWIAARTWHYKERRVFYKIELPSTAGRKVHSRRYWESELEPQPIQTPQ